MSLVRVALSVRRGNGMLSLYFDIVRHPKREDDEEVFYLVW